VPNTNISDNIKDIDNNSASIANTQIYNSIPGAVSGDAYAYLSTEIPKFREDIEKTEGLIPNSELLQKKLYLYKAIGTQPKQGTAADKQNTIIALNGIYSVYNEILPTSKSENLNLNNLTLQTINALSSVENSSDTKDTFAESDWVKDPSYQLIAKKYPNNNELSYLMFVDYLLEKNKKVTDNLFIGSQANTISTILEKYSTELSVQDRDLFVKRLKNTLYLFAEAKETEILNGVAYYKEVLPYYYNAYAHGVLSNFDSSVTDQKVRDAYTYLYNQIAKDNSGKNDYVNFIKFRADLYLAKYLFIKNNFKINNEINGLLQKSSEFPTVYSDNKYFIRYYNRSIGKMESDKVYMDMKAQSKSYPKRTDL
jgi:hypothetical protein